MEFPRTDDIENDVMRVLVKDSWQPPALLLENFGGWEDGSLASQTQSRKSSPVFWSLENEALPS